MILLKTCNETDKLILTSGYLGMPDKLRIHTTCGSCFPERSYKLFGRHGKTDFFPLEKPMVKENQQNKLLAYILSKDKCHVELLLSTHQVVAPYFFFSIFLSCNNDMLLLVRYLTSDWSTYSECQGNLAGFGDPLRFICILRLESGLASSLVTHLTATGTSWPAGFCR